MSLQGAVSEHLMCMTQALRRDHRSGKVVSVRQPQDMKACDALIIPGGESTTISRILVNAGLHQAIKKRMEQNDIALMGTCAGCALLATELSDTKGDVQLLRAMEMQVQRNAFGRQKESFERFIDITGFDAPFHAVFIRAPVITKVWGSCKILAQVDKKIVMARQGSYLALSFHPELTNDLRVHELFLQMV